MPDISTYLKQAEELDKKRGISSNPSVMPAVTPGGTVKQTAGPDISAYLAQAEKLDRERSAAPTTTPNTTRADGAGVGGNGYEIQMPKLEVNALGAGGGAREGGNLWDRIRDTLSGGIKQSVGGNVDTMGTMYEATQGQRDTLYDQQREWTAHQLARAEADLAAYTADGNAYMAKVTQGEVERLRTQLNAYDTVKQGQVQQKATTAARDMAAQVTQSGAQDIERAKEGLGLVGQALVDAGASGVQMLGDAGFGALTGVGGLAPMAFRAFGGGTQKARAEGADLDEQILYGGAQAAKEWVTEKLFSVALPFAKTYGKGSLDDVVEKSIGKAVDRFAKSALGKRALGGGLTLGAAALGEGLEEGLGTFLEWQLPRIYGGDVASFGETLEEAAYNTLVGSLSGLAGGVVTPQVWSYQQTAPQTAQGGAEAAQEGQNAPAAGNETPAPSTGTQRPQNTPVSFENTAAADILLGAAPQKQRAGFTSLENAMANQFERETGISIESVESILGGLANGDYNSANWVARIAQDAKDPKMVVVAHELTHHLQTLAPQEYESFRTAVADYFTRAGGEAALTDMMNRYRSAYGAAGQNLSDSAVMDEMAADFTEVLLTDADLFGQFAQQNRTLAERLLDALRAFIEKIRATFTGRARDAAAQEATGKTLSELEMIAEQWQGVYSAAAAAYGQNANTATQEGDGVRYSLGASNADTYSRIYDMQVEVNNLSKAIKELEDSADFKEQMDKLSKGIANDNVQDAIDEYRKWQESSGYDALYQRRDSLKTELENLRKEREKQFANEAVEKEKKAIAKSGLSEADYFHKQAVKEFGYTPYFYDAGYILPNGKMLNFSGEKGKHFGSRGQDHRAIGTIYEDTSGTDALNRFMRDGNIRIMAESPGIDISTLVEPSKEQYATIRKFINEYANKGYFNVDLSDENGRVIGSLSYENRVNSTRIINDIKHYYATGEIREQSDAERFRYSIKDSKYLDAVERGDMDTAQRMVDEAAKAAGYDTKGYHGTHTYGFTSVADWLWLARDKAVADTYGPRLGVKDRPSTAPYDENGVYPFYYRLGSNISVYADGESWGALSVAADEYPGVYVNEDGDVTTNAMAEWAQRNGYDSITFLDVDDGGLTTVDVVFNPKRDAKSSNPVTYDENGNVIPLSQRFDETSPDIRYSMKDSKYLDAMEQLQNLPEEDRKIAQTAIGRVRHSDNQASMTDKRLDAVYSDYAYGKSDKTKAYLTYIDPYDFLSLTTSDVEAFLARNTNKLDEGVSGWGNKNNIRESGAMFLRVDEDGNVIGHEGRHRMAALYRAGYRKVAVAIDTGYTENAAPISMLRLNGQDFGNSKSYATRYVHRLLPVTKKYESINRYVFGYDGRGFSEPQNMRFSLKTDSDGRQLSDGQKAYFANSKSVDAQGRLRVMYRGGNSNFTVFDRKKSSYANLYGRGFYFTDSKSHAEQYGGAREFYLNITNPVPTDEQTITREQLLNFLQAVAENEDDYSFENYGYGATPESMVDAIYSGKSDFAMLYDVSQTAIGDMVEAVELFNEINGTDFDGLILDTETVIFNSEQAKLTDNKTPTDSPDIRFSLKDKRVPTYKELIAKPDMVVVDISTPKTQGTFSERRKKIKETVPEVIKKPYLNRDTETMIFLTKRSYTHAFNNNKELDINAAEHFPELIENAILTHAEPSTHGNENANGVYTFFAAARGKEDVPVKLKVKEIDVVGQEIPANVAAYFEKNPKEYAEAYDSVVLEVLEIEESPNGSGKDVNRNGSFLTPAGLRNIKVADFLSLVNGDESKYLPKSGNMAQLKSTAPLRQMMAEMPQQMMIRMPRLTTVAQDEAEAAGVEAAPMEDTVQLPQLGLTDADVPGTEPLTRQDIARELAWRARMANEPAAPQAVGEVKLPDLSEEMEEAGMGLHDFTGNVETVPQEATAEILSALEDLSRDMEAPMETPTDATVRDAESLISAETVEAPQSLKEKAAESWAFFKRKMVDSGEAVTQIGKAINDKYLYPFYNMARASASAGANMIAEEQTDVNGRTVGESLNAIFDPIRAKGEEYYTQFQTYMYDLHNIARMSMDQKAKQEQETAEAALAAYTADHPKFINMTEAQAQRQADSIDELEAEEAQEYLRLVRWVNRAARMGNKPVFDYDFTAEMSRGRSERLLREHPEFAQYREQVRKYIDNMMQYRVDSGLITQQDADFLREYYPDYIPTYRRQAFEDFGAAVKKKRVQIGKTVGRATGGNTKLVPLHEALGKQTMQVVREGSKNRFGARLLQDYTANASNADIARYVRNAEEYESDFSIDTFDSIDDVKPKRGNTFSVYLGGKLYDMTVDNALFEAVEALSPTATEQNTVTKVVHDVNKLYKALITGYNPTFAIRNTVRDLQTAGLYSRDFAAWAKNYPKALAEIKNDGPMWKQYKALGGDFSSVFDYMTGTVKKPTTKAGKVMDKVQALNMAMEQAPRLAEFMAVMESGDGSMESAMDAMLAAADVTVNFGRGGTWGKMLNANYVPFLNPGIQGFDKMVRYATQSRSGKQWLMMAARAAALGIAPSLINALLYHDDEEWEELRDSDKDTNYMFKLKDGMWLKIPKGRELSVLGIAADRVGDALQGEEVDIRATLNTMANQVAPANPLNQNILKAAYDTQLFDPSSPGRTWYGGDIEGQRLQNYAPGERYDSSTDVVSKAIGGALNLSPKKLNYLADQYTGVVGDIVLPLLTPQAERDMFSKAFTVDSISSNELSSKFYEKSDELTYAKNGGDAVAAVVSRYWNSISSDVSKLYGEIRNVENSDLSNREKKEQVQELQRQINAIQREALATVDQYTAAVESSLFGDDDDAADFAYRETNREVFGAKSALETYNKDVYAKAQEAAKNGVSYEAYYDYYFATKDIESDKDASGKTIPGSKREKVLAEINAMDLTVEQKNALYYASGYAESTLYEAPWYTIQMPRL